MSPRAKKAGKPRASGKAAKAPKWKGVKDDAFAGHALRPGDFVEAELKVSESVLHKSVDLPMLLVRGEMPGPTLFITGAVHGDEVLGAAIVRRVLDSVERRIVAGALVCLPVVNRFGFDQGDRYLPDRRDLNRHFPGDADGNMAARIAHTVFHRVVLACDRGIDLHTAASGHSNLCHIRGDAGDPHVRELMRAFGTPIIVDGDGPRGSLRRAATEAGVPTVLYEAGEPRRFQPHAVALGHQGVLHLMARLGMVGPAGPRPPLQILVRQSAWVRADHGGIIDLKVEPGDLVRKGDAIATVFNPYGREVDDVLAASSGVVLGTATDPLAHPGMALAHIGHLDKTFARAKAYVDAGGDLGHVGWGRGLAFGDGDAEE
ncbi:MAG TPA: succinylglutamate desuccinylase/aspartoacylase family protein [Candidatus Thermoplasmatota archaeon]|nr:succinylglutamate desuccinylase/aspartoacylase family protein [Candidatus Thermoplasmatota archaeon]